VDSTPEGSLVRKSSLQFVSKSVADKPANNVINILLLFIVVIF